MKSRLSKTDLDAESSQEFESQRVSQDQYRKLTPVDSIDENQEKELDGLSSISDENKNDYKNEAYWSLPENVRKAIDFAK